MGRGTPRPEGPDIDAQNAESGGSDGWEGRGGEGAVSNAPPVRWTEGVL